MRETFTEQLRRVIGECGETRYSIAQRTGIDQSTMTRFMNGTRGLSMEAIDRLFDALDLEIKPRRKARKRRSDMASLRKRGKLWYYRFTDADGVKRSGRVAPTSERPRNWPAPPSRTPPRSRPDWSTPRNCPIATIEARPLADHLAAWRADLTHQGVHSQACRSDRRPRASPRRRDVRSEPDDIDGKTMNGRQARGPERSAGCGQGPPVGL